MSLRSENFIFVGLIPKNTKNLNRINFILNMCFDFSKIQGGWGKGATENTLIYKKKVRGGWIKLYSEQIRDSHSSSNTLERRNIKGGMKAGN